MSAEFPSKQMGSSKGDTLVVLSNRYTCTVHSSILREHCVALAPLLTTELAAKLTPRAMIKTGILWRIDLSPPPNIGFRNIHVDQYGLTAKPNSANDYVMSESDLIALRDVLGLLHRIKPDYGNTLESVLDTSLKLVRAAETLGCLPSVRDNIEKSIFSCPQFRMTHVAEKSSEWLSLAQSLQSRLLWREALIHTIGKWKLLTAAQHARVVEEPSRRDIVICQLVKSWEGKKATERSMFAYYPPILKEVRDATRLQGNNLPGRGAYGAHIFSWIALDIFRQWLGQMSSEGASFRAADGGYLLYTALSKGGDEYLKRGELDNFYTIFPMTDKAKSVVNQTLNVIKEKMKEYVADHIVEEAQMKGKGYLTSCKVEEQDFPWNNLLSQEQLGKAETFLSRYPEHGNWIPPKLAPGQQIQVLRAADLVKEGTVGELNQATKRPASAMAE